MARFVTQQPKQLLNVPIFLAPAFSTAKCSTSLSRLFSSSSTACDRVPRGNRDKNKKRGVSVIRMTGPRRALEVSRFGPLPRPVAYPKEARAEFEVNPNHGLWGFFADSKEAIIPPSEEDSHGRPWTRHELSKKSWEDLYRLYWTCVKELNIVRTRNNERKRLRVGYGVVEGNERAQNLKRTMHRIRLVLLERHHARFDADLLLKEKFIYDIFPDILQEYIREEDLAPKKVTEKEAPFMGELAPLTDAVSLDASLSQESSNVDRNSQSQKVT